MNGLIHPCCHPENKPAPKNEDDMMIALFEYIDRIFSIVRPRRLLYMAIDGVAPRAKMNEQRARRFRASKEAAEKIDLISRLREELLMKGSTLPPEKPNEEHFDKNCITPGTPFMARLAKCLHYYIHDRLNNDAGWSYIEVILSDGNVPGEGEHKIMDFIRKQQSNPEHDANTQHCLFGADADLIMLGLATHEPNFTIIRGQFKPNQPRPCELCGQLGHEMKKCPGSATEEQGEFGEFEKHLEEDEEFIFIRLNVLREYLQRDLFMENLPFEYDFERVIDDWIFLCIFIGNDFLPHLPSLDIRRNAITTLVQIYKRAIYRMGGFLTNSGDVDLNRVQMIMTDLSEKENKILGKRVKMELAHKAKPKGRKKHMKANMSNASPSGTLSGEKRKREDEASGSEPNPEDDVRLMGRDFKNRYYKEKFRVDENDVAFRQNLAMAYTEGLCWVLKYYYQGCASWNWYYPYHYPPFASDFMNLGNLEFQFDKGKPLKPLEQLMAVLPAASKQHVPESWGELMCDPKSPIINFYPKDVEIDLNGKKHSWQGIVLLPFVDERRLFEALKSVYPKLTEEEIKRNTEGKNKLYICQGHKGYEFIVSLYDTGSNWKLEMKMDPNIFSGLSCNLIPSEDVIHPKKTVPSPIQALPDIPGNRAICISFEDAQYSEANKQDSARQVKGVPVKCD